MIASRRVFSAFVLVMVLGASACQPAAPVAPTQPPAAPAAASPTQTAAPVAQPQPTASAQQQQASAPLSIQLPPTQAPIAIAKAAPTPLPYLPTTTLGSLSTDQAATVTSIRQAVAAGDYARAIGQVQPLIDQLSGDPQQEVRLLFGQALVGHQQFDDALALSEQLIADTTDRLDVASASHLLKGEALRGLQRYDEAATEMRGVANQNPLVAAAVDDELVDMWTAANRPDQAVIDGQKGLDLAEPRLLKIDLAEKLGTAYVALDQTDAAMNAYRELLTAAGTKGYLGEQLYNLAVGASQLGNTDDAINALRTSIQQFPRSRTAPDAV